MNRAQFLTASLLGIFTKLFRQNPASPPGVVNAQFTACAVVGQEQCPLSHCQVPVLIGRIGGYGPDVNGNYLLDKTGNMYGWMRVGQEKSCNVCGVKYVTWNS